MKLKVITAPVALPVTLDQAKAHLKVLWNDEDADITIKLKTAIEKAEQITNRKLGVYTYKGYLDQFPSTVKLPNPPLVTLTSVEYIDTDGNAQPWTDWYVDEVSEPAVLYFNTLPTGVRSDNVNNVILTFDCGYATVPDSITSWILLYTATLYEHRENLVEGTVVSDKKAQYFNHLLDSYRIKPI